jgi:hypothetical protein
VDKNKTYTNVVERLLESRWLTIVFGFLCVLVLVGIWKRVGPVVLPSEVYLRLQEEKVFVITYHKGCSCGSDVDNWIKKAKNLKVPVLLIARENSDSVKIWSKESVLTVFIDGDGRSFRKYSIDKLTTFNVLSNGKTVFQSNKDSKVSEFLSSSTGRKQ